MRTSYAFRIGRRDLRLSTDGVLQAARSAIERGQGDIFEVHDWYLEIDGRKLAVKKLFALLTGLGFDDFTTQRAVGIFQKLGLEPNRLSN
jgi:hypothetical protein